MVKTLTNAFVGLLLTTAVVTASAQVPGTASGAAEKEVLQTLDAVDQATDKRDKAALERLMADEFIYHGSNGTAQTKAQSIAQTTAGGTAWSGRKYDNVKVRIYGDIAVVTGSTELLGKSADFKKRPKVVHPHLREARWPVAGPRRADDLDTGEVAAAR
jgi:hypothetical protein